MTFGVGILGAGPGVAALHLPTLARAGGFDVVHVADRGSGRAAALAERVGGRASTGTADILADPAVDVLAICTPPDQHAAQVLAAVDAGIRAVFCEKPLAVTADEAHAVVDAARAAGTALMVGTNHLFDPAWARAKHHLLATGGRVQTISVTLSLPPNDRYHALVTEPGEATRAASRGRPDMTNPDVAAAVVRQLMIGLGVHDLPIVRDLAPRFDRVVHARPLAPIGYTVGLVCGDVLVDLTAVMLPSGADALWRIAVGTSRDRIEVDFPPAFVHAGSAEVRVHAPRGGTTTYAREPDDGYLAEWRALAALLERGDPVEYDEILADALFAVEIADATAAAVRKGMS